MKLHINHSPVELTLESEETLGQLIGSLRLWAEQNALYPVGFLVDGKAYDPAAASSPLARVGLVELETVPHRDESISRLAVLADFFGLAVQASGQGNNALLRDLQNEYPAVRSSLLSLGFELSGLDADWGTAPAGKTLQSVHGAVEAARQELENPGTVFAAALGSLATRLTGAAELSALWQRGQDGAALGWIHGLMENLETLNRVAAQALRQAESKFSWTEWQDSVNPFLKEVEAALAGGDFVLVNDLLEYEITPRLDEMRRKVSGDFILDRAPTPPLE